MTIQIEIDRDKLTQLFEQGVLCAADFRCLNNQSKQQVTKLCLNNCAKRMRIVPEHIPIVMYKRAH